MVTTSAGRRLKFWGAGRDSSNVELARKGKRIKGLSFLYWLIITRPVEGAGRSVNEDCVEHDEGRATVYL